MKVAGVAVMLVAGVATAAPFPETLPQADIDAIVDAVRKALPPVDHAAATKCEAFHDAYNKAPDAPGAVKHILDAAACFRAAGALSTAIIDWNAALKYSGAAADKRAALRGLGPAFEAAGLFDRAAAADEQLAMPYANDADANERLQRALCIRRQLGDVTNAKRDADAWQRATKMDPNLACDGLRPIAMP
jgi:tetratricopeptide (TPR) repeat protein